MQLGCVWRQPCVRHPAPHPFQQCNVRNGGSQPLLTFLGPHPFVMFEFGSPGMLGCGSFLCCCLGFRS